MPLIERFTIAQREANFERLLAYFAEGQVSEDERSAVVSMLNSLKFDCTVLERGNSKVYLGMRDAPASKGFHHAYKGGLVQHYLEMLSAWETLGGWIVKQLGDVSKPVEEQPFDFTHWMVLQGVVFHDLHKAHLTYVEDPASPSGLNYGNHASDLALTADQKTCYLLSKHGIQPTWQVLNALYNSEGGYAKNPPKTASSFAKLLYVLDELSANVVSRLREGNSFDIRTMNYSMNSVDPLF